MDEKYILKIQANEDRSKSNTRRIDDLENDVKNNNTLALNVRELTIEIKHMREDYQKLAEKHTEEVRAIDTRLSEVERKPVKRYEQIVSLIITRYSNSSIGSIIRQIWIVEGDKYETSLGRFKKFFNNFNDNSDGRYIIV